MTRAPSGEKNTVPPPSTFDATAVRGDFPILSRRVYEQPLTYLDSAATSQKPEIVISAIDDYYRTYNANVRRGVHALSAEATDGYDRARETVARFIGASDPAELIFTRGTTESINLVAIGWGLDNLGPDDAIVTTEMEHHANLVPWQLLSQRTGCELRFVPITDEGTLELAALDRLLNDRVKLLAFVHISNALGTSNPVADLVAAAKSVGALVLLDGAQSVPHRPVDVVDLGIDFLAFSGHKMCGPTGIGGLWARREVLEAMQPYQGGGEMIRRVTLDGSTWADIPEKFEAGTPPIAGAIGLARAVEYLAALGMEAVQRHERELTHYALEALNAVPGLTIYGPRGDRGGLVSFTTEGIHPHDLSSILDRRGIAIRAGHHCAMPIHERYGLAATTRASFYVYNDAADIDKLVEGILHARELFGLSQ